MIEEVGNSGIQACLVASNADMDCMSHRCKEITISQIKVQDPSTEVSNTYCRKWFQVIPLNAEWNPQMKTQEY